MLDPEPRMALFFADYSLGMLGLRDGPIRFIYELGTGRSRMFDLEKDPREGVDISARHAPRIGRYARGLRNWSGAQRRLLATARPAVLVLSGFSLCFFLLIFAGVAFILVWRIKSESAKGAHQQCR